MNPASRRRMQICAHVFIDRPQNCARILFRSCAGLCPNFRRSHVNVDLVVRTLNCARFFFICALNCARIRVVRVLNCAQFLLHAAYSLVEQVGGFAHPSDLAVCHLALAILEAGHRLVDGQRDDLLKQVYGARRAPSAPTPVEHTRYHNQFILSIKMYFY